MATPFEQLAPFPLRETKQYPRRRVVVQSDRYSNVQTYVALLSVATLAILTLSIFGLYYPKTDLTPIENDFSDLVNRLDALNATLQNTIQSEVDQEMVIQMNQARLLQLEICKNSSMDSAGNMTNPGVSIVENLPNTYTPSIVLMGATGTIQEYQTFFPPSVRVGWPFPFDSIFEYWDDDDFYDPMVFNGIRIPASHTTGRYAIGILIETRLTLGNSVMQPLLISDTDIGWEVHVVDVSFRTRCSQSGFKKFFTGDSAIGAVVPLSVGIYCEIELAPLDILQIAIYVTARSRTVPTEFTVRDLRFSTLKWEFSLRKLT